MKKHLLLGLAWVMVSGCASSTVQLKEHGPEAAWTGTAMLLDYDLKTDDPAIRDEGCTLTLREIETDKEYAISLSGQKHRALFDAPAGIYRGKMLSCPHFSKFEMTSLIKGAVRIEPEKINYLGKIIFDFAAEGDLAKTVNADRAETTQSLLDDMKTLPSTWQSAYFNPFTHKPLTPEMAAKKSSYQLKIVTKNILKKGQAHNPTAELESSLMVCDSNEQRHFPYRIGTLKYTAVYEGKVLKSLTKEERSSFSDEFLGCVDQTLRDFQPQTSSKLEVQVSL